MSHDTATRRRGFLRCGVLLFAPAFSLAQAAAAPLPLSQAINRAGKMRALSQRLSKARLLQALDKDHQGLLETVGAPRKDALEVARSADVVLESADRLTKAFEAQGQGGNARVVNLAGRQRMLAQRAARAYFLAAAGHDTPAVRAQLAGARSEIAQGLAGLQAAPISTAAIRNELELARSQWLFYEGALARPASADALQTVATTSERVFEVMDNLTALYDAALRDLLG